MASFKEAFAAARKAQGAGGEFTWKGNSYSTNIAGETGKKKKPSFSTDMVDKAIDKASGLEPLDASVPRPQRRPTDLVPAEKGIRMPKAGDIKVEKLPYEDTSLAGRAGSALGTYIGRQMAGPTKLDKLKSEAADQTNRSKVNQGAIELMTGRKGAAAQYKEGGVVKMKKSGTPLSGTPLSSTELKKLNLNTGIKKVDERDAKFATYADRGTSGRDAGLKEAAPRLSSLRSTYERSKDMIERYGKDAPKGRSFMAYEGQSGTTKKQSGGVVKMKEGSAKDMREDKAMAKKHGMTMKQHEASRADKKHDAPKKMAGGGVVKKAGGGSMRGAGCAVRGKGFSGSY